MWPQKVIARIEGGLGNQLFQYAAARSLADRLNCELALDLRGLAANGDRPFQLNLYNIRATIATEVDLEGLSHWRSTRITRIHSRLSHVFPKVFSFPTFWPSSFAFDKRFNRISRPAYLVGYWQSEKYFSWNRERILQDITLLAPLAESNATLGRIKACNSVAMHIRRGDYVTNSSAAEYHGLCDMSYYHSAIEQMKKNVEDIEVFVFSDDLDWARNNLQLNVPMQFVADNSDDRGYLDLELISQCKNHIVANSSFSWWGAWRAQSLGQHVYAPKRWFRGLRTNTTDVIPSRWHAIG